MMIRLGNVLSLIFFVITFILACKWKHSSEITIVWNNKQATAIAIPRPLLNAEPADPIFTHVRLRLKNKVTLMLGSSEVSDDQVIFKPLIPLTPGQTYEVLFRTKLIGEIKIPAPDVANAPSLTAMYPTADTLPENLLKIYLKFSAPMREGEALEHIYLLGENNDTLRDIFLDLQPELWNPERTVLTLWLDPGRIKRDLVPNQQMGKPLQAGRVYTLVISNDWKDVQGLALKQSYRKRFHVAARDSISPNPKQWQITVPKSKNEALKISFTEALDNYLLQETIAIVNDAGKVIEGRTEIMKNENGISFYPQQSWAPGKYRIRVQSHLEDLAGNNLNRLFDRDVRVQGVGDKKIFEREFMVVRE